MKLITGSFFSSHGLDLRPLAPLMATRMLLWRENLSFVLIFVHILRNHRGGGKGFPNNYASVIDMFKRDYVGGGGYKVAQKR